MLHMKAHDLPQTVSLETNTGTQILSVTRCSGTYVSSLFYPGERQVFLRGYNYPGWYNSDHATGFSGGVYFQAGKISLIG